MSHDFLFGLCWLMNGMEHLPADLIGLPSHVPWSSFVPHGMAISATVTVLQCILQWFVETMSLLAKALLSFFRQTNPVVPTGSNHEPGMAKVLPSS